MEEEVIDQPIAEDVDNDVVNDVVADDEVVAEDDSEEIEHGGEKYRVPKALKDSFLMHRDYTQKTQEVAEQRRQLEAQQKEFMNRAQLHQQSIAEIAKVVALDEKIQQYEQIDWSRLSEHDPIQAQKLFMQYTQAKDMRNATAQAVIQEQQMRALNEQQNYATTLSEQNAVLQRDIKDWSPKLAKDLGNFAMQKFGFDADTVNSITDARVVKLLHAAYVGDQIINKSKPSGESSAGVKPVTKITGGKSPSVKDPGKMSDAEYAAWRSKSKR